MGILDSKKKIKKVISLLLDYPIREFKNILSMVTESSSRSYADKVEMINKFMGALKYIYAGIFNNTSEKDLYKRQFALENSGK